MTTYYNAHCRQIFIINLPNFWILWKNTLIEIRFHHTLTYTDQIIFGGKRDAHVEWKLNGKKGTCSKRFIPLNNWTMSVYGMVRDLLGSWTVQKSDIWNSNAFQINLWLATRAKKAHTHTLEPKRFNVIFRNEFSMCFLNN